MRLDKLFRRWLDAWWREHHPSGGGEPPTLAEAFAAGVQTKNQGAKAMCHKRPQRLPFLMRLLERIEMTGDKTPATLNLAADILRLCAGEGELWSHRCDDAKRFPEVLDEAANGLRQKAVERDKLLSAKPAP